MKSDDAPNLHEQARARLREGLAQERARAADGTGVPTGGDDRAAARDPDGPEHPEARRLYQEALAALERQDAAAAEDLLRRSLSREDGHPAPWRELALLLAAGKRHEECQRAAEHLLARAPGDPDALRLRAQSLDARGDEEAAILAWTALAEHQGELPGSFRRQAMARLERLTPAPVQAEARGFAANRMPRLEPPRPEGPDGDAGDAYAEALEALQAEAPDVAEAALRRSLSRDDAPPEAWRELGLLLLDLERLDEAPRPLQEALRRDPDDLECRRALAVAADRTGDVDQALSAYRAFLEAAPETSYQRARLHAERRVAALARGEVDVAPEYAQGEVVELTPSWSPARQAAMGAAALALVAWLTLGGTSSSRTAGSHPSGPPAIQQRFLLQADALVPGAGAPVSDGAELVERSRALLETGLDGAAQVVAQLLDHPDTAVVAGVIEALAADAGAAARAQLSAHVVKSHDRQERRSVEAAVRALLETDDPRCVSTMVGALAVAARRQARDRAARQHIALLQDALGQLPPEEVSREARGHVVRATPARGPADRNVLEALRPWMAH